MERIEGVWRVEPWPVGSPEAAGLLRAYYTDVADRWYRLHRGRPVTAEEVEAGLAGSPSDHLAPPEGLLLLGTLGGEPAGCAGLRLLDAGTAELKRVFVHPRARGTGGGARLLDAAHAAASGLGVRRIVLNTRLDLTEARALYTRHGYRETAPLHDDDPYAEIWYARDLGRDPGRVSPGTTTPGTPSSPRCRPRP